MIDYRLVVTTDGRAGLLERTLRSHDEYVTPRPSEFVVVDDSGDPAYAKYLQTYLQRWRIASHERRLGFCATVEHAWALAAEPGPPYVFWTEDDLVVERPVDLDELAAVLDREPLVAQMGLMRGPVNDVEHDAGGLFNLYRDRYEPRDGWLLSRTNFSTTHSLMRRDFMAAHRLEYPDGCEGRFTIDLLAAGFLFGVWGDGSPWTRHIGDTRAGHGY